MSIENEVGGDVAQIHAELNNVKKIILPGAIVIDLSAVRDALDAIAAEIASLGGSVTLPPVPDVEITIEEIRQSAQVHVGITEKLVVLLIDQSNFSGNEQ